MKLLLRVLREPLLHFVVLAAGLFVLARVFSGPALSDGGDAIVVSESKDVLSRLGEDWHGQLGMLMHAFKTPVLYLALGGLFTAWYLYVKRPDIPDKIQEKVSVLYTVLDRKYYFDDLWIKGFGGAGRRIGDFLWKKGDQLVIDGVLVNGTANSIGRLASVLRQIQTGYLYTYAFAMIIGLTMLLGWLIWVK